MKLRSIAILFALAVPSAAAYAQSGVYASFDAQDFTRTGVNVHPDAPGSANTDSPWLLGPVFGAFYTIHHIPKLGTLHTGPVAIGIDARGDIFHGSSSGWPKGVYTREDALVGLRLTPTHPMMHVMPYVQGSAGEGHTKIPGALIYTNNWSYQFAIGADRKLKGRMDWRVVEASAGFLNKFAGGANTNNSNYIITVGTGLVVRLGGK
jgi:hypothetical protein